MKNTKPIKATILAGSILWLAFGYAQAADTATIKLGFLDPLRADTRYNAEFLRYDRMVPVYRENHIEPTLIQMTPFFQGNSTEEQIYRLLKPFHAVALINTFDSSLKLTPEMQALAPKVRAGLLRYVREGGGLIILPQGLRYPGDDDIRYWNLIFEGLGLQILSEGVFDPTRSFQGKDIGPATYWYTQNIKPHAINEGIQRLVLPLYPAGRWAGVPAIKYSPEWEVVVSGEKEAKSFQCGSDNNLNLEKPGVYSSAPPVVACRTLGAGRIVCFPLAHIHAGENYNVPVWDNTVETRGDPQKGLPSDTLKMMLNAYHWIGEPALSLPQFGASENPPYKEIEYPATVEWDKARFSMQNKNGIRGILGAVSQDAGGKGTVADYVQAAKAAGLSFIVFADPLEKLTPETLNKLKADCAAASKARDFYACPGVEFSDGLDNRWAFWGEKVVFPEKSFKGQYNSTKTFDQWDGQRVRHYGQYIAMCNYSPSALLDYKQLRAHGAHPENMWWFYDYLPLVYSGNELVADNYTEFLHGLNDQRWASLASFTRVEQPSDVPAAAATCFTGFRDLDSARKALNTRCGSQWVAVSAGQYVSQGPLISSWEAINQQMESNWTKTRGAQRVRLKFTVSSDAGIAEVKVHDGERDLFRRFAGNGARELTREFECVQDQQHDLTLEVADIKGRRAFSWVVLVYSYKQGLTRCGDNLNFLNGAGLVWHPDRNEMMPMAKHFENGIYYTLAGWDSGNYLCPMPQTASDVRILTTEEGDYPQFRRDGVVSKILDVPLSSYNLQIATQTMTKLAEPYDTETRTTPAMDTIPRDLDSIKFFERTHTIYAPDTRADMYTVWNYRRPREGIKDYRGGLIWHEGKITFTKDVTLKGKVPIKLLKMTCPLDLEKGWGNTLVVTNEDGTTSIEHLVNEKKPLRMAGRIHPGGYAAILPSPVGCQGFLAPVGSEFAYEAVLPGSLEIGLGKDGQVVKAGTEFSYQFAVGTFADPAAGKDVLADASAGFNMNGGKAGYPIEIKAGKLVDGPFFCSVKAENNEASFKAGPRKLIIDLPFRIQGLEDNGCAAVFSTRRPWFRFVPVVKDTAYFQEPIDDANEMWVGNIFVCDNKAVKVTVVVDGQAIDARPFVEVHNPTEKEISATLRSPAHTPHFGGWSTTVKIPAGDSVRLNPCP